jgi:hypothetical protein
MKSKADQMPNLDMDFLRQEYFHLQKTVEEFDQRALSIKTWSVTVSMAGIGVAITQKAPIILLLAAISSLLFWVMEVLWKSFQLAYYFRIQQIEGYMRGESNPDFSSPDINRAWGIGWRQRGALQFLWWPHICLPHIVVFIAGTSLWVINHYVPFMPK